MLVLSRKLGERIHLRDKATGQPIAVVSIVDIDRGKIRLGFVAGQEVEIMREELLPALARPVLPGTTPAGNTGP